MTKKPVPVATPVDDSGGSDDRAKPSVATRFREATPSQAARDPALRPASDAMTIARALVEKSSLPRSEHAKVMERFKDSLALRLEANRPLPQQRISVSRVDELDRADGRDRGRGR